MINPGHNLELSIVNYLSGSTLNPSSLLNGVTASFYCGYDNVDLDNPPIVIVDCNEANELYFNTRNYEFITRVFVKEMAADTSGSVLGALAQAVMNEFVNSTSACQNFTNTGSYNIAVWQCQTLTPFRSELQDDALITEGQFRIIGALVPSI